MAFWIWNKTKEEKKEATPTSVMAERVATTHTPRGVDGSANVLRNPRITEKATDLGGQGAYVFDVAPSVGKRMVAEAVERIYNVKPRMVRIVRVRGKVRRNARTGHLGVTSGGKKAYVYLKQGDSITLA